MTPKLISSNYKITLINASNSSHSAKAISVPASSMTNFALGCGSTTVEYHQTNAGITGTVTEAVARMKQAVTGNTLSILVSGVTLVVDTTSFTDTAVPQPTQQTQATQPTQATKPTQARKWTWKVSVQFSLSLVFIAATDILGTEMKF